MIYLSDKDIIAFNYQVQKAFALNCDPQVTDIKLLRSVLHIVKYSTVFGEDQFPDLPTKAGHLWYMLSRYQIFNNGNKRTAIMTMLGMLFINQASLDISQELITRQLYVLTVETGQDQCTEEDLVRFIKQNLQVNQPKLALRKVVSYSLSFKPLNDILATLAAE